MLRSPEDISENFSDSHYCKNQKFGRVPTEYDEFTYLGEL